METVTMQETTGKSAPRYGPETLEVFELPISRYWRTSVAGPTAIVGSPPNPSPRTSNATDYLFSQYDGLMRRLAD